MALSRILYTQDIFQFSNTQLRSLEYFAGVSLSLPLSSSIFSAKEIAETIHPEPISRFAKVSLLSEMQSSDVTVFYRVRTRRVKPQ